ncbi:MAG TPA: acyl carrier protein [bacterium]|jgi:acyl carrier protein|nr:acyl carrier protein [bacterium]
MALIEDRLQTVMRDVFDRPDIALSRAMTASDVEEWDSLSHVNLVVAVEKEFGLHFTLAEIKPLKNVGEMLDLIRRKGVQD